MAQKNKQEAEKMTRERGLVITLHPTEKQIEQMHATFGCVRFVYNHFLDMRNTLYRHLQVGMTYKEMSGVLTELKQQPATSFLKKVDKFALQNALKQLETAYRNFFEKRAKFPRFKSKRKSKRSYKTQFTNDNIKLDVEKRRMQLPKLGWVSCGSSISRYSGEKIMNATVSRQPSGVYQVSICLEETLPAPEQERSYTKQELHRLVRENQVLAGDLGIRTYLTCSNGVKVENPRHLGRSLYRMKRLQRKLSRQIKGSRGYQETQSRITKLHAHIANQRKDFLHKLSHALTEYYQIIILEDLHVKGMVRNKKLARHVQDAAWGTFKTFVSYKARWKGKTALFVDQWFPSSKLCSSCQTKHALLTLSDETWVCPHCRATHQRDENASVNLLLEGIRRITA